MFILGRARRRLDRAVRQGTSQEGGGHLGGTGGHESGVGAVHLLWPGSSRRQG